MPVEKIIDFSPTAPSQKFTILLAGEVFGFHIYKSSRTQHWYLTISDFSGAPIVSGLKMTTLSVLHAPYISKKKDKLPEGWLWLWDTEGRARDPKGSELGNSIKFFFRDQSQ
tara:strand:- start:181 stop:516 length:336 start_codon:yes stop_codon:yes gene_type:complete